MSAPQWAYHTRHCVRLCASPCRVTVASLDFCCKSRERINCDDNAVATKQLATNCFVVCLVPTTVWSLLLGNKLQKLRLFETSSPSTVAEILVESAVLFAK